jgi:glycosyltransferase involved in cell wall biosynthesis
MKKILVLNYEFPPLGGGASPVSYEVAKRLSETGKCRIDVVTMGYKDLLTYEEINENFRIHRVRCLRTKKEICHPWEQMSYLVSAYFKARRLILKEHYDICHTHFIIPTGVLSYVFKRQYKLPYVITSHGSDVLGYGKRFRLLYPILTKSWKAILRNAQLVTSPSHFLAEAIVAAYGNPTIPASPLIIPNGIDTKAISVRPKKNIIFSSGRLLPNKGFQYLIEAVAREDCGYEVHIAGDGPIRAQLEEQASHSKTKIIFHGWLLNTDEEYRNLLETAAIFVLASDKENASIVLLEALAAGSAVITTSGSGTAETVGNEGLLFAPRDVVALRGHLTRLINDDTFRCELQQRSRHRAECVYDWNAILTIYQQILL